MNVVGYIEWEHAMYDVVCEYRGRKYSGVLYYELFTESLVRGEYFHKVSRIFSLERKSDNTFNITILRIVGSPLIENILRSSSAFCFFNKCILTSTVAW